MAIAAGITDEENGFGFGTLIALELRIAEECREQARGVTVSFAGSA
ncbi:hypothetical protein [Mycolicibacterium hodleri]|nr:hypothetical protein [Mycolicibacterium hodleri]